MQRNYSFKFNIQQIRNNNINEFDIRLSSITMFNKFACMFHQIRWLWSLFYILSIYYSQRVKLKLINKNYDLYKYWLYIRLQEARLNTSNPPQTLLCGSFYAWFTLYIKSIDVWTYKFHGNCIECILAYWSISECFWKNWFLLTSWIVVSN